MSKLLELKKWLTVPEAAERLSTIFKDKVTEADVFRLALDGHLVLSINLVNGAHANLGRLIDEANVEWKEVTTWSGGTIRLPMGVFDIGEGRFVELNSQEITTIWGVWDLPRWDGLLNFAQDIEAKYQAMVGGPEIKYDVLMEPYLEQPDGTWCRLMVHRREISVEDWKLTEAFLEAVPKMIRASDEYLKQHPEVRDDAHNADIDFFRTLVADRGSKHRRAMEFVERDSLPDDAMFVIRTEALRDFEQRLADQEEQAEQEPVEDTDKKMAAMFDSVHVDELERLFPTGKWGAWTNNAKRYPALHIARTAPAQWNPYLAAQFLKKKVPNWKEERIIAALKKALPERSEDKEWMLDP